MVALEIDFGDLDSERAPSQWLCGCCQLKGARFDAGYYCADNARRDVPGDLRVRALTGGYMNLREIVQHRLRTREPAGLQR